VISSSPIQILTTKAIITIRGQNNAEILPLASQITTGDAYALNDAAIVVGEKDIFIVSGNGQVKTQSRSSLNLSDNFSATVVGSRLTIERDGTQEQYRIQNNGLVKEKDNELFSQQGYDLNSSVYFAKLTPLDVSYCFLLLNI
jgi:hypothetical protein